MLNKIFIMGRLVRDPELRRTQSGTPVASFTLAVDRDFKDKQTGERATDFIDVVAWRSTGEFVSRYFTKGRIASFSPPVAPAAFPGIPPASQTRIDAPAHTQYSPC